MTIFLADRKIISLALVATFIMTFPVSAQAVGSIGTPDSVPVVEEAYRAKEVGVTLFGVTIPGITLDGIAIAIAKVALEQILNSTTDWINNGFEGNPAYVTDPKRFFINVADNVAGTFIEGSDLAGLCSPFGAQIKASLSSYHRPPPNRFQCTLTGVVRNLESFYSDFSQGGWGGWFSMTQNNANNPYGAYIDAQAELDSRIANAIGLQNQQLSWNSGFLSWSDCQNWEQIVTGTNPDGTLITKKGMCIENGPVKTPGKVIESQLENVLGSGVRQLELADELDELISALFSQLLKKVVFGAQGLLGSGGTSGGSGSGGNGGQTLETLSVYTYGASSTVTSIPSGIDCGSDCAARFSYGTSVTLTAVPDLAAGSMFTSWFGGVCPNETSPVCTLSMTTPRNVTALFALRTTLRIFQTGGGSGTVTSSPIGISCGSTCSADYPSGTSVTLIATPDSNSVFTGWTGNICSGTANCTVNMSGNISVGAGFSEIIFNE